MAMTRIRLSDGTIIDVDMDEVNAGRDFEGLDMSNPANYPLTRALSHANMTMNQQELEVYIDYIADIAGDPSNSQELIDAHMTTLNILRERSEAADSPEELPSTINGQASIIDPDSYPDRTFEDVLKEYGINTKVKISKSFTSNLESLAGSTVVYADAVRDMPLLQPKAEVTAKLLIIPEWDSKTRMAQDSEKYKELSYTTTDFVLQTINEQEAEKYQIIETLGESYVYFYGQRPRVYSFSGSLLNAANKQWKNKFMEKYREIFRGTKCAENKTRAYIMYEDLIVEGYILNLNISTNAQETKVCPFSITMYITNSIRMKMKDLINATTMKRTINNILNYHEQTKHVEQHELDTFMNQMSSE